MAVSPTTKTTRDGSSGSPTHEKLKSFTTNDFPSVQYFAPASSAFRISAHGTYGSIQLMDVAFHLAQEQQQHIGVAAMAVTYCLRARVAGFTRRPLLCD